MVGIAIAVTIEWEVVIEKYHIGIETIKEYPFGVYFSISLNNKE